MAADFVPLGPSRPATLGATDFRVRVVTPAHPTPSFVPAAVPAAHTHAGPPGAEPTVTLRKEGNKVVGIQIQCSCGQVIDLTCQYDSP